MTIICWQPAGFRDVLWWLRLRNEPEARAMSLNNRRIGLLEHLWWYIRSLLSKDSCLYVGHDGPFGERTVQVRYQRTGEHATVSITVDRAYRGRGIGRAMLIATRDDACLALDVKTLRAVTLPESVASRRMLGAAGYADRGTTVSSNGKRVVNYRWPAT